METKIKITSFILRNHLLDKGDRVILGVSGGVDSMVLLDVMNSLKKDWSLKLAVAHVNHLLRAGESDEDEWFVHDACIRYGIPFHSKAIHVHRYSTELRLSLEEAARNCRFHYFEDLLHHLHFNKLALGHQSDDQAETILMNLFRGSGLRGLSGMRPSRSWWIHPMLDVTREEILLYARNNHLGYREDRTNRSRIFLRNRIRHEVIQSLKKITHPGVVTTICRSGLAAAEANDFLVSFASAALKEVVVSESDKEIILDIQSFLKYIKLIQKIMLLHIFEEHFQGTQIGSSGLERIILLASRGRSGGLLDIGCCRVQRYRDELIFHRVRSANLSIEIEEGRSVSLPGNSGVIKVSECDRGYAFKHMNHDRMSEFFDLEHLSSPWIVRFRKAGDDFMPLGMRKKKKLHEFFIDERVPVYRRDQIPLLVSGDRIAWVVGYRIDDRFKLTKNTKRVLKAVFSPMKPSAG